MKFNKILFISLFSFLIGLNAYSQIDIFGDEDDEEIEELNDVNFNKFMAVYMKMGNGETGPGGDWVFGSLEMMADPRFADAPKEYSCAYIIKTKELRMLTYEAMLDQMDLSCVETKKVLESYIMFLGTIYLDMFSMDFFLENELDANQLINSNISFLDATEQFNTGKITRYIFSNGSPLCNNDMSDIMATDCDFKIPMSYYDQEKYRKNIEKTLKKLNPGNVAQTALDLQSRLNSLPCK